MHLVKGHVFGVCSEFSTEKTSIPSNAVKWPDRFEQKFGQASLEMTRHHSEPCCVPDFAWSLAIPGQTSVSDHFRSQFKRPDNPVSLFIVPWTDLPSVLSLRACLGEVLCQTLKALALRRNHGKKSVIFRQLCDKPDPQLYVPFSL